jgi:SLT domain-containing protein
MLRGIVQIIGGLFKGDFHQVWEGIKTSSTAGITALKGILSGAWKILKAPVDAMPPGCTTRSRTPGGGSRTSSGSGVNAVIDFLNVLIKAINFIPGIPDIKPSAISAALAGAEGPAFGGQNAPAKLARGGAFARTNGIVNRPMTFMGEEAPQHPEFVIPTNPAYRDRARGLLGQAAKAVGFAKGGVNQYNHTYPLHHTGTPGAQISPSAIEAIARSVGDFPPLAAAQIAHGEANYMPGIVEWPPEADGAQGYGLMQMTTGHVDAPVVALIKRLGGWGQMLNPVKNLMAATALFDIGGLSRWHGTKFLGGGGGMLGGIAKGVGGSLLRGVGLGGLVSGPSAADIIGKFPAAKGLGLFGGLGKYVIGKATGFVKSHVGAAFGGGGGATSGPSGVGSFAGVPMANWVAQALQYAQGKLGYALHPTSGYRPGFDPHTASGHSEHSGTQYPHGAVDFGGYHDAAARAVKMAVVNATRGFKYPLLAPQGFVDDGHASGTGHALGTAGAQKGLAWVGEHGPELVNFAGGERVYSNPESLRMAARVAGLMGYATGTKKQAAQRAAFQHSQSSARAAEAIALAKAKAKPKKPLTFTDEQILAAQLAQAQLTPSTTTSGSNSSSARQVRGCGARSQSGEDRGRRDALQEVQGRSRRRRPIPAANQPLIDEHVELKDQLACTVEDARHGLATRRSISGHIVGTASPAARSLPGLALRSLTDAHIESWVLDGLPADQRRVHADGADADPPRSGRTGSPPPTPRAPRCSGSRSMRTGRSR